MAGGKETPRQKMIGMMYLVLTALLAMNVSAAILEKFAFLNNGMQNARDVATDRNSVAIDNIESIVKERGSKPEEMALVSEAKEIKKKTKDLLFYIEELKARIVNESGGLPEGGLAKAEYDKNGNLVYDKSKQRGMIPGAKNRDAVMVIMVTDNSEKGEGANLKKKIDEYVKYLNSHADKDHQHKSFAYDGKTDPNADEEQKDKNFAEYNFEETPAIAALAVLSQLQSQAVKYEAEVLAEKSSKVGASDFKFDMVSCGTKAKSQTVAAGTKYEAEIFLSATSSTLKPKIRWKQAGAKEFTDIDSTNIVGGVGKMEFRASAGGYDKDGNSKRKWVAELSFKGPDGMVTKSDTVEYTVSKPVIQIQSASVSALYLNCGNKLNVQVPALGQDYNPTFGVSGGSKRLGKDKGFVTIIPSSPKVVLSVSSGGALIGKQEFKVRKIPLPTIQVLKGGRKVNMKNGFKACPRSLEFKAVPDASFKEFLPQDARYMVVGGTVELARGKRIVQRAKISGGNANLSALKGAARDGDRIIVEIKKVVRKNFLNNTETVKGLGALIYQIPINA